MEPATRDQDSGQRVLLRALIKHLDGIGDAEITEINLPTGVQLLYELDAELRPLVHRYLNA